MLVLTSTDRDSDTCPLHSINSSYTAFDILKQFLPNDFLVGITERRYDERASRFTISKGRATNGGSCNYIIKRSAESAITYLAMCTLIQGKQKKRTYIHKYKNKQM
eukprot:989580-Ditylum_brightwellii.AAC.1